MDKDSTCAVFAQVQKEGSRNITRQIPYYNLDVILSVGYRVSSKTATQFRKWAKADYKLTPESIDHIKKGKSFKLFYRKNLLNVGGFENLL